MPYSPMTSTTFDEATYISTALAKIQCDYSTRIDRIILDHYMVEIGHDLEREAAIYDSYRSKGETPYRSLYDILYFAVNKAIDSDEMHSFYLDDGALSE